MRELYGIALEQARKILSDKNKPFTVIETASPRRQGQDTGAYRVVRVSQGGGETVLTVCRFLDDGPSGGFA